MKNRSPSPGGGPLRLLFYCHAGQIDWFALLLGELRRRVDVHARLWVAGEADRARGEASGAFDAVTDLLAGFDMAGAAARLGPNLARIAAFEERCGQLFYQEDLALDRWRDFMGWGDEVGAHLAVHLLGAMERDLEAHGAPLAAFGENNTLAYRLAHRLLGPAVPYWGITMVRHWDHRFILDHDQAEQWPECRELYRRFRASGVPAHLRPVAAERLEEMRSRGIAPLAFRRFGQRRGTDSVLEKLHPRRVAGVLRAWRAALASSPSPLAQGSRQLSPLNKARRTAAEVRRKRFFDRVAALEVPEGRRFALYLLQVQPEHSVEGQAFLYRNQLAVVENIAAALPADVLLVVKEHRPMVGVRELDFHRRLASLPNVLLVSDRLNSFDLVRRARAVFTLTGSAALEAMYIGVPAVVFGDLFYDAFEGIYKVESLRELRETVRRVLRDPAAAAAGDEAALAALAAMYAASHPGKWEATYTDEEIAEPANLARVADVVERALAALAAPAVPAAS